VADDGDRKDRSDDEKESSLKKLADSVRGRASASDASESPEVDLSNSQQEESSTPLDELESEVEQDVEPSPIPSEVTAASNILLLGPLRDAMMDGHCVNLLTPSATVDTHVVIVTVTQSVDAQLERWRTHATNFPDGMTILTLGEDSRGAERSSTVSTPAGPTEVTIKTLSDPSDLTRLGITLNRQLTAAAADAEELTVCLHSLTGLLQYVSAERLFRFVHILQKKVETLDLVAHYHLDPSAHEVEGVNVFRSLFDTVVTISDDGTLEIESTSD
jgi:hypothetical protein